MIDRNGSAKSPTKTVVRNTAKLFHDAVTLVELQAELVKIEAQQSLRKTVRPVVLLIAAACLALGCTPVLLLSLAYVLIDAAGLSHGLSLLIAGCAGLIVAVAVIAVAIRRLTHGVIGFSRSIEEFKRNISWMKQALQHGCNPAHDDCSAKTEFQRTDFR